MDATSEVVMELPGKKQRRAVVVGLRVSETEARAIRAGAERSRRSLSDFLRLVALDASRNSAPRVEA